MAKVTFKSKPDPTVEYGKQENGLAKIQKEFNPRLSKALTYKATDVTTYGKGGDLLKVFNDAVKRATEEKKKTLDPAELTVKRIKEQWKPFEDGLKSCIAHIKSEMDSFAKEQARLAEVQRAKILADNRTKPETKEAKLAFMAPPDLGSNRKVLKLEVYDEKLIPREYLVIDEVKLKTALKEGVQVPGARMVRDSIIVTPK